MMVVLVILWVYDWMWKTQLPNDKLKKDILSNNKKLIRQNTEDLTSRMYRHIVEV
jgi:hypothetical protein